MESFAVLFYHVVLEGGSSIIEAHTSSHKNMMDESSVWIKSFLSICSVNTLDSSCLGVCQAAEHPGLDERRLGMSALDHVNFQI